MGSFVFKWPHPEAKEVYVTGTFDDWGRTEKLDKVGDTFEKEVQLPDASEKILYKFVVDENWITDHTAPQEDDGRGNINNVLKPEDIKKDNATATEEAAAGVAAGGVGAALLSSAHPESTSAQMAGEVPKETKTPARTVEDSSTTAPPNEKTSPPGAFPATPAQEPESFSVNPIPASEGASNPVSIPAGEKLPDHQEITQNTVDSHVTTSKEDYEKDASSALPEEKSYGVNPMPASEGAGNPVSIPAGEKLPDHEQITQNNVESHVTTSKEDYEKDASSALPKEKSYGVDPIPASAGIGNPVSIPAGESVQEHESFMPESREANATTSKEDYEKAGGAAMPVGAATESAIEPKDSGLTLPDRTRDMIPGSSLPMSTEPKDTTDAGPFVQSSGPGTTTAALAGQVPLEPKSTATVLDDETPSAPQEGAKDTADTAPFMQSSGPDTTTAALAGQVPLEPESKATVVDDEKPSATVSGPAPDVPEVVKESLAQAHESPEAAASSAAVEEKKEVENELLQEVKAADAAGEPAPTAAAAMSATAPSTTATDSTAMGSEENVDKKPEPSGEISTAGPDPAATAPAPSSPVVTTGVADSKTSTISTPQKTTTPTSSAATSPVTTNNTTDKKKKRTSLFGKLKEKLKG